MMAVSALTNADSILQYVNKENLTKIESFLNDSAYREAIENSSTYNSRLCRERRLRMPFLDSQTGVAQNHSALFMSARERLPGLLHGQIYTYPSKRWRKKRRQYLMNYFHPKRVIRGDLEDGIDCIESTIPGVNDDSKDSLALKDEHSKDAWFYDESDMLDMDQYDEPDPDSDFDYEESYSSKRKRRKGRGGHHPTRGGHPPAVDSPTGRKAKGGGRGRKKVNYDASDTDKPFVCDLCSARYKTRPGLVYHYGHSHSTSSGDPAKELSPSPADVESRNVADAVASDQPGGSRRGRQGSSSTASSSPSVAATSSSISGSGGGSGLGSGTGVVGPVNGKTSSPGGPNHQPAQHQAQQQQQQQQTRQLLPAESSCAAAPASPTVSAISKDDHHPHHQPHQHPQQQQQPQLPHQGQHPHSPVGPPGGPLGLGVQNNSCLDSMGDSSIPQHHQGNQHHAGGMDGKKGKPVHPSPYCDFCLGNARENKKTGGSEELVSCSDCGRSGHPTCLQFTANMIISVRKYKWQCIECKCCSICGTSDNDDQLLFCDDCDRGYHMYCLAPPLTSPPEGSWSCRLCIAEFHQGIPPPSRLP